MTPAPLPDFQKIKQFAQLNLKNVLGWKTKRKIVVFAVDDYGNVRLASPGARRNLDAAGFKVFNNFDLYDSLENSTDLEMLYDTLNSVKDKNKNPAKFTAFAVPCNIDFEKMAEDNYSEYSFELLPETYEKLSSLDKNYEGTWNLWQEGIKTGILYPQFHGREHINLKILREKLHERNDEIITDLKNRSYTSISHTGYPTIDWSAAFDFWEKNEIQDFEEIILDGLDAFEKVFGFRALHFNAPGQPENKSIHSFLFKGGIKYIDSPLIKREHRDLNKFKTEINYLGKKNQFGMVYNIRNVLFEPGEKRIKNWVEYAIRQIETAFFWNKPAVISSHRVNYCGNISAENRSNGLSLLRLLLDEIMNRWPDTEFMNSVELMNIVSREHEDN